MYKLTVLSPQTDELMCLFFCLISSHFGGARAGRRGLKGRGRPENENSVII